MHWKRVGPRCTPPNHRDTTTHTSSHSVTRRRCDRPLPAPCSPSSSWSHAQRDSSSASRSESKSSPFFLRSAHTSRFRYARMLWLARATFGSRFRYAANASASSGLRRPSSTCAWNVLLRSTKGAPWRTRDGSISVGSNSVSSAFSSRASAAPPRASRSRASIAASSAASASGSNGSLSLPGRCSFDRVSGSTCPSGASGASSGPSATAAHASRRRSTNANPATSPGASAQAEVARRASSPASSAPLGPTSARKHVREGYVSRGTHLAVRNAGRGSPSAPSRGGAER